MVVRLPGTEEWSSEKVLQRIMFEQNIASAADHILREMARGANLAWPEKAAEGMPSDALFALGRAAELAFADDNFDVGVTVIRKLLSRREARPKTPFQFAFYATVGALTQSLEISFSSSGVSLAPRGGPNGDVEAVSRSMNWPQDNSVRTARLIQLVLPAAAAAGKAIEAVEVLVSERSETRIKSAVRAALSATPEFKVVVGFVHSEQRDEIAEALANIEDRYAQHLSLLRSDAFYWNSIRPRGMIIDWPLLALRVAALRGHVEYARRPGRAEVEFIEALAEKLARFTY